MKLALVVENFDPTGGGAERNVAEVARHLATRGHEVSVVCARCPLAESPPGIVVERFGTRRIHGAVRLYRFSQWARQRIQNGQFDLTMSTTMAVPATVVQPLGGTIRETLHRNVGMRLNQSARVWKRLLRALSPKQQMLLALERRTIASPVVRVVAAASEYVVEQFKQHYRFDPARIEMIPNAVDLSPINGKQRQNWRRSIRDVFGIGDGSIVFLFAAFNPRLKGVRPLLRAMRSLKDRGLDTVLLMAAPVQFAQQAYSAKLEVRDRVRFVGPTEQMMPMYCASDVTVLPTFYDPASRVVIESLIMGVPAITTTYNGASELIRRDDGRMCGRVLQNPHDVGELAGAMAALTDEDERRRCREATAGLAPGLSMHRHVDQLEILFAEHARTRPQVAAESGPTPATTDPPTESVESPQPHLTRQG